MTDDQIIAAKAHHASIMQQIEDVVALARLADPEDSDCAIPIGTAIADLNEEVCAALGVKVTYLYVRPRTPPRASARGAPTENGL